MAVIKPTIADVSVKGDGSAMQATWTPVTEADSCQAVSYAEHSDKSIHVSGTFGGGSVAVQGSNNGGVSYAALRDPASTTIAITAETIRAVLENTTLTRPAVTGGAAQSLTIAMLFRMTNPLRT